MTDYRVNTGFLSHFKTKKLRKLHGSAGVEALQAIWSFAAENRADGVLRGIDRDDLQIIVEEFCQDDNLVENLCSIGFLERDEAGTFSIHDWVEHNAFAASAPERQFSSRKANHIKALRSGRTRCTDPVCAFCASVTESVTESVTVPESPASVSVPASVPVSVPHEKTPLYPPASGGRKTRRLTRIERDQQVGKQPEKTADEQREQRRRDFDSWRPVYESWCEEHGAPVTSEDIERLWNEQRIDFKTYRKREEEFGTASPPPLSKADSLTHGAPS